MDLPDAEEVAIAQDRLHVEHAVAFGKRGVGALREVVAGGVMLCVVWFVNVDEAVRVAPNGQAAKELVMSRRTITRMLDGRELSCERY